MFAVRGGLSAQTAPTLLEENAAWTARLDVIAQVADYRVAKVELSPFAIRRAALQVVRAEGGSGLLVPTALLVQPDQFGMWRDYAWLMAQAGIRRAVFTEFESALAWSADQSALWAAQAAYRKP